MNILFSNIFYVSPTQGGTERVTYSVGKSLQALGHTVYSIYSQGEKTGDCHNLFCCSKQISDITNTLALGSLLKEWSIDVIIVQGAYTQVKWYRNAIQDLPTCKLFFAHHFEPTWEFHEFTLLSYWRNFISASTLKSKCVMFVHMCLYPIERYRYVKQLPKWYSEAYNYADKVVLLCNGFIKQYAFFAGLSDTSKFVVIPNMLSFDSFGSEESISHKLNQVIIVSRMSEPQKRISLALTIWNECLQDNSCKDWNLYVIGEGEDLENYKNQVRKQNIPNVIFWGRQNPLPFYQVGSIFMMTSLSEAWGLTLTESMQNGVVPLAFDTYAALHDIITDGYDGYIVPEGNMDVYVTKMKILMTDVDVRRRMALNGLESSKRFTSQKVGAIWNSLITGQ